MQRPCGRRKSSEARAVGDMLRGRWRREPTGAGATPPGEGTEQKKGFNGVSDSGPGSRRPAGVRSLRGQVKRGF